MCDSVRHSSHAVSERSNIPHTDSPRDACDLCGLPVGRSRVSLALNGDNHSFCCAGCSSVFQILYNSPGGMQEDFRETDLYRTCMALGLIAKPESADQRIPQATDPVDRQFPPISKSETARLSRELIWRIEGMWCSACSWVIEHSLHGMRGVVEAEVLFFSDLVRVKYFPHLTTPQLIQARIEALGYRPGPFSMESESAGETDKPFLRLGLSSILTANIMMISFALYLGFFQTIGTDAVSYFSYPLLVLATPVVFYGGFPIMRRVFSGIRHGAVSMDTLIAVGALSAYFYSIVQVRKGSLHLYFDTAAMLITVALLGKFIETHIKLGISRGINDLFRLYRGKVRLVNQGRERWVSSEGVEAGTEFVIRPGERSSLDGVVVSGNGRLDESVLTGEPRPVAKSLGDYIAGGSLLLEGELRVKTSKVVEDGSISQMIQLIQDALAGKTPREILADRLTRWLVPGVLFLAGSLFFLLESWGFAAEEALLRSLTVLVITCPCVLGVAIPLAKIASISVAKANGLIIREHQAFEQAKNLDLLVFDKTGTLTAGSFSLTEIITLGMSEQEALRRVASVEVHSDHFLAREIKRAAQGVPLEESSGHQIFEGMGVRGVLKDGEVAVGSRAFINSQGLHVNSELDRKARHLEDMGSTVVFFSWEGKVQGLMGFGDALKESATDVVAQLGARGISVRLVSGDSEATTRAVAAHLGIEHFTGQALPQEKMEIVKRLQSQGYRVGFVGDGINDALALTQADVGFALGEAARLFRDAGHVSLLGDDPGRVLKALDLSGRVSQIIRQNLFFSFFYNLFGIPLAVVGMLNPLIAVLAMFVSSLTVIGNTLRFAKQQYSEKDGHSAHQGPKILWEV